MPRGGSKRGEHRGNAKPRDETGPKAVMHRALKKPTVEKRAPVSNIEKRIFISQVIHGIQSADDMTPKQVMLDNMHNFQNAAYQYEAMVRHAAQTLPDTEPNRAMIRGLEMEAERNRRIASDEAYKVGPFIHPRLAAIAMRGDDGTGEDIIQQLYDEIDKRNREHPIVIEHLPQKKTA